MRLRPPVDDTPRAWAPSLGERVRQNTERARNARVHAAGELRDIARARGLQAVASWMPDAVLCDMAEHRAEHMGQRIGALDAAMTDDGLRAWLSAEVQALGARPLPPFTEDRSTAEQLVGAIKRTTCRLWWRRQLRRAWVTLRELEGMQRGEVCRRTRQPYCTDDTVRRKAERNAANADMLAATEIEAEDGERITLAQAVAASVSNKGVRRGELMTRIRGCEEWADEAGMVGIFTTNTAPSRFHPQTLHYGANPRHDGSTPRDAQAWLCRTWARTRAALQRRGVRFFGFRVAEPHHDGCPHWHMLLWCDAGKLDTLRDTLRDYWLSEDGDEKGAAEHRFKAVTIDRTRGSAVGYVSKYIAKNIDDVNTPAHLDEHAGEQAELFGATARRVEAWASAHGIRQFQAIGQPPVTVWRELRRVKDGEAVALASAAIQAAHRAAHRQVDGDRASWRGFLDAQGGAMVGRHYRVRVATEDVEREGRYERRVFAKPVGVVDAAHPAIVVRSDRRERRPAGTWPERVAAEPVNPHPLYAIDGAGRFAPDPDHAVWEWAEREAKAHEAPQASRAPRTRFHNCTQARPADCDPRPLFGPGGLIHQGAGGLLSLQDDPPWATPAPPTRRNAPSPASNAASTV